MSSAVPIVLAKLVFLCSVSEHLSDPGCPRVPALKEAALGFEVGSSCL